MKKHELIHIMYLNLSAFDGASKGFTLELIHIMYLNPFESASKSIKDLA